MTRDLRAFQAEFIELSADGLNVLWSPTGSGKTFALIRDAESANLNSVLYLTATPELVDQVAEEIRNHQTENHTVARIARGKEYGTIRQALEKSPRWIVATPGRLDAVLEEEEHLESVEYCIIDEADHLIHEDRVELLTKILPRLPNCKRYTAASASFRKKHLATLENLTDMRPKVIRSEPESQSIKQLSFIPSDDKMHKLRQLVSLLPTLSDKRGIIFCPTQAVADQTASKLSYHKIPAVALTGGKNVAARRKLLTEFRSGAINWFVTTDIASRGIDVEGVDAVIHLTPPINVIELGHRNGRAGRRGEEVSVFALCTAQEWNKMAGLASKANSLVKKWLPDQLAGTYKGPKKIKASGKAASKQKRKPTSTTVSKTKKKTKKKHK